MLNFHLNLIFVSLSLYFIIRQTSATIFEETSLEESLEESQLIEKQLTEEKADDSEPVTPMLSRSRRTVKFRVCGRKLIDMLHQACNGCTRPIPVSQVESDDSLNFRRKRDVHEHHHDHSRRTKRGLVDQCCVKQCTMETIKMHCSPC